ncbi:MAG: macro domain-containing protein [Candidatus Cloacimonetes bacterium]|nr:macro domain-containing protein [Candidatus Cloacimonadota bacterium]
MFLFKQGDILNEPAEALVNTVNCDGVMGRGIALQFKKKFPENFRAYATACAQKELKPGKLFVFKTGLLAKPHFIINFPTKNHWRSKSRIEDVEQGLEELSRCIRQLNIRSIAIPPLGCGLGGLDWAQVRPIIEDKLASLKDVSILVFEPASTPKVAATIPDQSQKPPLMTPGRACLIGLMDQYLRGFLDPFISLLEVHKLMYFMQEAGEPLRLKYKKAHYGPYAENLRHVLNRMDKLFISGYSDGGDQPDKQLTLMPNAVKMAHIFLKQHSETLKRFQKVAKLVEGFESPFGLELLATVHWIKKHDRLPKNQTIYEAVYAWNENKKQFSPRQITLAENVLHQKGWI